MSKNRRILSVCLALGLATLCPFKYLWAQKRSPFKAELRGNLKTLINPANRKPFRLSVRSAYGGLHQLVLRPRKPFDADYLYESHYGPPQYDARLFQGKIRIRHKSVSGPWRSAGVAIDIVGNVVHIIFHSTRRGIITRLTTHISYLEGASRAPVFVSYLPSAVKVPCGLGDAVSAGRAFSAATNDPECGSDSSCTDFSNPPPYSPRKIIDISTAADRAFFLNHGSNTNARIQAILNSAEALYLNQLGAQFNLINQYIDSNGTVYKSTDAETLLLQLTNHGNSTAVFGSPDVVHLFTGRNLNSNIIGLAWQGTMCSAPNSKYGLTQATSDTKLLQHIITAHEIGHNANLNHDDPSPSVMARIVKASNTVFTGCSRCEFHRYVNASGSCLASAVNGVSIDKATVKGKRSKRKVKFNVRFSLESKYTACKLFLYGAVKKSSLDPNISSDALLLKEFTPANVTAELSAKIKNGRSVKKKRAFLKALITCSDNSTASSSVRKVAAYMRPKKLLNRLQKALQ
ncbi:MAG: hypothetical protein D6719_04440 [Candidatus Dadabacteria bacterium]|nr:MAG: hypothetical protein D6719_04440 [Candidatus Dadabacteria bacterium]